MGILQRYFMIAAIFVIAPYLIGAAFLGALLALAAVGFMSLCALLLFVFPITELTTRVLNVFWPNVDPVSGFVFGSENKDRVVSISQFGICFTYFAYIALAGAINGFNHYPHVFFQQYIFYSFGWLIDIIRHAFHFATPNAVINFIGAKIYNFIILDLSTTMLVAFVVALAGKAYLLANFALFQKRDARSGRIKNVPPTPYSPPREAY